MSRRVLTENELAVEAFGKLLPSVFVFLPQPGEVKVHAG